MSSGFVFVCEDEELRHEGVELPTEGDNNLLLAVVQSQFEGASGLKYRSPTSGLWRAVKIIDGVLYPPESGWGGTPYVVVRKPEVVGEKGDEENGVRDAAAAKKDGGDGYKRKMEDEDVGRAAKNPRSTSPVFPHMQVRDLNTEDLIILGLEYSVNDAELKKYFEQFGEVAAAEVKKDMMTQKSRGFGFVRFFDHDLQMRVQSMQHTIKGRRVEVKHPRKSMGYAPSKLFVGCLPLRPEVDNDELREYFGQFGVLTDVYVPTPYRGFGFVTYQDGEVARKVLNMSHTLRKSQLNLSIAEPRGGRSQAAPTSSSGSANFQYTFDPYHQQWFDPSSTYAAAVAATAAQQNSAYGYGTPTFGLQGYHRAPAQPGQTYSPPRGPPPPAAAQSASFVRHGYQTANRAPPPSSVARPGSPRTVGQPHYSREQHGNEGYYGGQHVHQQQQQQQKSHGDGGIPWQNY